MAAKESSKSSEAYPMKGGDGLYSYTKNSYYQREIANAAKGLINEAIAEELDFKISPSSNTFRIADLGCSVGPNTFFSVQNIVEAVELKYQSQGLNSRVPEFQVFFNDHALNDFNTLFTSLPPDRRYYAAGVPGSFYGRLFPDESLFFVHSSFALHWLSKVPEEVVDKSSPAWNKGRIYYSNAADEVAKAYSTQYAEDMECFFHARAQEIVCGGLIVLIVPGRPNGTPHSHVISNRTYDLVGSCLMDMAKKGLVSEEKVDSFNIPIYNASPQELEAAIDRNGCFSIEMMASLPPVKSTSPTPPSGHALSMHMRAALEGLIKEHFGHGILDELFDSYAKKFDASPIMGPGTVLVALLKRKATG
ncbi:hypothetical protein L1049_028187 [Liquidambar formosana]|uniref:S-adenosylmethionine-dependent methyltransferase n=1 Tax=Liquidambar formosana TaxID=63359 RepID=A0AAP0RJX7_LIQFO